MSDAIAPAATGTPAVAPVVAAPAAPVVPPAAAPPALAVSSDPDWLPGRIEQAKRAERAALLAEIGAADPAAAKAAIAAAQAAADANKTAEQRAADATAKAAAASAEIERYRLTTTEYAARMLGVLEPAQLAAVKAIAGDDPAAQLRAITALAPTWTTPAAATVTTPAATTSPAPSSAPSGTQTASPPDHRSQYQLLKDGSNPFKRAAYGLANQQVYTPKT